MMLVSFILNTLAIVIDTVNRSYIGLSMFYPTVSLFIRYGELLFLFGLIGLWIGTKKDKGVKWLSLLGALTLGAKFFLIEFSFFEPYSMVPILLSIVHGLALVGLIMKVSVKDCPLVVIKGYVTLSVLSIYIIHLLIYSLLKAYQSWSFSRDFMLPMFYVVFQLALYLYFKEWYKEGFQYQNEVLYRM